MKVKKLFHFFSPPSSGGDHDTIEILELLDSEEYAISTWPCALALAAFITKQRQLFQNKVVLEIGAGTGLPGILCSKISSAQYIYLSDRADQADLLSLLQENINLNKVEAICSVVPLSWDEEIDIDQCLTVDIILASDIFYYEEEFDNIMFFLYVYFQKNPYAIVYTTYQQRSSHRTIAMLLHKYSMIAEEIPLSDFIDSSHQESGICQVIYHNEISGETFNDWKSLNSFDDIFLFKIMFDANNKKS